MIYSHEFSQIFIAPGRVLYLGPSLDFSQHAHHAVQLCLGLNGPFEIVLGKESEPVSVRGVMIAPDLPHQIFASDNPLLFVYLDPESSDYSLSLASKCTSLHTEVWLEGENKLVSEIDDVFSKNYPPSPVTLINLAFRFFGIKPQYQKVIDPRIQSVLNALNQSSNGQCSIEKLELVSCLSRSRLQHLFREQIGIPIRRYSLWLRIQKVIVLTQEGKDFTHSALLCGFADSAHFSRIFKDMFGVPPKMLLSNNSAVSITICDEF